MPDLKPPWEWRQSRRILSAILVGLAGGLALLRWFYQ